MRAEAFVSFSTDERPSGISI